MAVFLLIVGRGLSCVEPETVQYVTGYGAHSRPLGGFAVDRQKPRDLAQKSQVIDSPYRTPLDFLASRLGGPLIIMIAMFFCVVLTGMCFCSTFDVPWVLDRTEVFGNGEPLWTMKNPEKCPYLLECTIDDRGDRDALFLRSADGWCVWCDVYRGSVASTGVQRCDKSTCPLAQSRKTFKVAMRVVLSRESYTDGSVGFVSAASQTNPIKCLECISPMLVRDDIHLALVSAETPVIASYDFQKDNVVVKRFLGVDRKNAQVFLSLTFAYKSLENVIVNCERRIPGQGKYPLCLKRYVCTWEFF